MRRTADEAETQCCNGLKDCSRLLLLLTRKETLLLQRVKKSLNKPQFTFNLEKSAYLSLSLKKVAKLDHRHERTTNEKCS